MRIARFRNCSQAWLSMSVAALVGAAQIVLASSSPATGSGRVSSPWVIVSSPNPSGAITSTLAAVSCSKAATCTAVGYYFTQPGSPVAFAEHFNGTAWSTQSAAPIAGASSELTALSCPDPKLCVAVGYTVGNEAHGEHVHALAESWNGSSWTLDAVPRPYQASWFELNAVSCPR
jgi:hypothetical protein